MGLTDFEASLPSSVCFGVVFGIVVACCRLCCEARPQEEDIERGIATAQPLRPRRPPPLPATTHPLQPLPPREPAASTCFSYGLIAGNKECVICQEEFVEEDQCEMLINCHHMYHHGCIKQWRAKDSHCPLCRAPVNGSAQLSQFVVPPWMEFAS